MHRSYAPRDGNDALALLEEKENELERTQRKVERIEKHHLLFAEHVDLQAEHAKLTKHFDAEVQKVAQRKVAECNNYKQLLAKSELKYRRLQVDCDKLQRQLLDRDSQLDRSAREKERFEAKVAALETQVADLQTREKALVAFGLGAEKQRMALEEAKARETGLREEMRALREEHGADVDGDGDDNPFDVDDDTGVQSGVPLPVADPAAALQEGILARDALCDRLASLSLDSLEASFVALSSRLHSSMVTRAAGVEFITSGLGIDSPAAAAAVFDAVDYRSSGRVEMDVLHVALTSLCAPDHPGAWVNACLDAFGFSEDVVITRSACLTFFTALVALGAAAVVALTGNEDLAHIAEVEAAEELLDYVVPPGAWALFRPALLTYLLGARESKKLRRRLALVASAVRAYDAPAPAHARDVRTLQRTTGFKTLRPVELLKGFLDTQYMRVSSFESIMHSKLGAWDRRFSAFFGALAVKEVGCGVDPDLVGAAHRIDLLVSLCFLCHGKHEAKLEFMYRVCDTAGRNDLRLGDFQRLVVLVLYRGPAAVAGLLEAYASDTVDGGSGTLSDGAREDLRAGSAAYAAHRGAHGTFETERACAEFAGEQFAAITSDGDGDGDGDGGVSLHTFVGWVTACRVAHRRVVALLACFDPQPSAAA